jgi:hypothetical protein
VTGVEIPGEDRLPPGPVRDFTVSLHELYTGAGRPGLRRMARAIMDGEFDDTISHQTVSAMLNGKDMPRWSKVNCFVRYLASQNSPRQDPERTAEKFLSLWKSAITAAEPTQVSETSDTTPAIPGPLSNSVTSEAMPRPISVDKSSESSEIKVSILPGGWRDPIGMRSAYAPDDVFRYGSSHPALKWSSNSSPPEMYLGVSIPSGQLGAKPTGAEIRRRFLAFLGQAPLARLVGLLLDDADEKEWSVWNSSGRGRQEAVLSRLESTAAPSAWAEIFLPDPRLSSGDNVRFIISIRCRPLPLMRWHVPFTYALDIPAAFAAFVQELGISIDEKSMVSVGVRLRSSTDISQIVNAEGYKKIPQSRIAASFDARAVSASRGGLSATEMAAEWIGLMCDYALHVDDYESALAALTQDEHAT